MADIKFAHCLFEQSGTFKKAFQSFGIPALDYDIANEYGETDLQLDLLDEIENAFCGHKSTFDYMGSGHLVFAFFPCTYFSNNNMMIFSNKAANHIYSAKELLLRNYQRYHYWNCLLTLFEVCKQRQLMLIVENPYHLNYLLNNFPYQPAVIDTNRTLSGDSFVKRTMYYFLNIEPCAGKTCMPVSDKKYVQSTSSGRKRSEISAEYAKNFIADKILGVSHANKVRELFDNLPF